MKQMVRVLFLGSLFALAGCYGDMDGTTDSDFSAGATDWQTEVANSQFDKVTGDELSLADRPFGLAMGDVLRNELEFEPMSRTDTADTACPGDVVQYGIDVSYYQGTIHWNAVKNDRKRFAFIRVSDGLSHVDSQFENNWQNAKSAGVFVGAYQFFRPSQDATDQADLMVQKLNSMSFGRLDLPPVIDVETTDGVSSSTVISRVNTWLQRVQSKTGRKPALYTSPGFWSSIGNPTPSPFPYLWVAHWTNNCPTIPPNWSELLWWQYSSSGSVDGISGNVDSDLFNGKMIKMIRL